MKTRLGSWSVLIAELVVVIVGILLALGIDQAQGERGERQLEADYLAALRQDFENTLSWTADGGAQINLDQQAEALLLSEFLSSNGPAVIDSVVVAYALVHVAAFPHIRVFKATMDDLVATGNLRVIQNANLRRELVEFFDLAQTYWALEGEMMARAGEAKVTLNSYLEPPVVSHIATLGWLSTPVWPRLDAASSPSNLRSQVARSDFLERMRADPELGAALSILLDDLLLARFQLQTLSAGALGMLETLEAEIGRGAT